MRKVVAICAVGAALVLSGCANKNRTADYSGESAAPYSSSRTAGDSVTTTRGDTTFNRRQMK